MWSFSIKILLLWYKAMAYLIDANFLENLNSSHLSQLLKVSFSMWKETLKWKRSLFRCKNKSSLVRSIGQYIKKKKKLTQSKGKIISFLTYQCQFIVQHLTSDFSKQHPLRTMARKARISPGSQTFSFASVITLQRGWCSGVYWCRHSKSLPYSGMV